MCSVSFSPDVIGQHHSSIENALTLQVIREALGAVRPVSNDRRIILAPNDIAVYPGDRREHVLFVDSGLLRMQHIDREGRRHILNLCGPGELIGINPNDRNSCSMEACVSSVLHCFNRRSFDTARALNNRIRRLVLRQQDIRLERVRFLTWMLCALRPIERINAFLFLGARFLPTHTAMDGSLLVRLPLPRSDMADLLGTSVETISRVTQKLHRDGVIEIMDPTHFRIPDLRAVMSLGQVDIREFDGLGLSRPHAAFASGAANQ